jgi:DNA-binding GntR family transcriptional regulator
LLPRGATDDSRRRQARSLVVEAYETIKRQILDNTLTPGAQFLEGDLSKRLGMSRTPMREALIRLESEGLVEVSPRHGMRVLPVSPEDMEQIYEILTALEASAAELLARRRPDATALAPMETACDAMEEAIANDDLAAWAAADEAFHTHLVNLCGNPRLASICLKFRDQSHRVRMITLPLRPKPVSSTKDHRALLGAIRDGDAAKAREIHQSHRIAGGNLLVDLLRRYNLKHL